MLRVLVALAAVFCAAASVGCADRQVHAYTPDSSSATTCPGRFPIKVTKDGVAYGPWLRGRYGTIVAARCYDSVANATRIVEQNK